MPEWLTGLFGGVEKVAFYGQVLKKGAGQAESGMNFVDAVTKGDWTGMGAAAAEFVTKRTMDAGDEDSWWSRIKSSAIGELVGCVVRSMGLVGMLLLAAAIFFIPPLRNSVMSAFGLGGKTEGEAAHSDSNAGGGTKEVSTGKPPEKETLESIKKNPEFLKLVTGQFHSDGQIYYEGTNERISQTQIQNVANEYNKRNYNNKDKQIVLSN